MRYLMFIKHNENYRNHQIPAALMEAMGEFVSEGFRTGALIDTAGLKPTSAAHRMRLAGGQITETDGPFVETKEVVGGYALMELKSDAEALDYARRFVDLHRIHWPGFECECEIRPLEDQASAPDCAPTRLEQPVAHGL